MPVNNPEQPLKVCTTCRLWSYQHKGFCQRLGQGVGRFYFCVEWTAAESPRKVQPSKDSASAPHSN